MGPRGTRVRELVDLLDVAPTIADVFGVRAKGGAEREFQGRSLLPVALGAGGKPLVLSRTVWDRPRYALRDGRFTYIYETASGREQLFDAAEDPGETKDRAAAEALRTAYYRETLHEWTRSVFRGVRSGSEGASSMTQGPVREPEGPRLSAELRALPRELNGGPGVPGLAVSIGRIARRARVGSDSHP